MSTESNKAVVRRYFEQFHNARDLSTEAIFAADLADLVRTLAAKWRTAFPDYQITIVDQVAEDDKVATVWRAQGTHRGNWDSPMGVIAGTGNRIEWTGTTTLRLVEGQITEVIGTNHDHLGILQQMGSVASVAPRPGA